MSMSAVPQAVRPTTSPSGTPPHAAVVAGNVFSINFMRHEVPSIGLRRAGMFATLGIMAVNVFMLLVPLGVAMQLQQQEHQARVGLHASGQRTATAIAEELRPLQTRAGENLRAMHGMIHAQQDRFPISGKLAALASTVPARTWIAKLEGSRNDRMLKIEALYAIDPAAPTDLPIKDWMNALKADARFGTQLRKFEMTSSARAAQGRAEVMRFVLTAEWGASEAGS